MQLQKSNLTGTIAPPTPIPHDEVAQLAARNWEKLGRPAGRDLDIWLQAERQLLAARRGAAAQAGR